MKPCDDVVGDIIWLPVGFLPFLPLGRRPAPSATGGVCDPADLVESLLRIWAAETSSSTPPRSASRSLPLVETALLPPLSEPLRAREAVALKALPIRSRPFQITVELEVTHDGDGKSSAAAAIEPPTAVLTRDSTGRRDASGSMLPVPFALLEAPVPARTRSRSPEPGA